MERLEKYKKIVFFCMEIFSSREVFSQIQCLQSTNNEIVNLSWCLMKKQNWKFCVFPRDIPCIRGITAIGRVKCSTNNRQSSKEKKSKLAYKEIEIACHFLHNQPRFFLFVKYNIFSRPCARDESLNRSSIIIE